jgi:hypothetical protein
MIDSFLPIQIFLGLFLIFAVTRVILRLKDGALTLNGFLFWAGLWVIALVGVFRPDLTTIVAKELGIGRGSDVVVYASIFLLFYMIFRTNVMLENLRHDLTQLVRDLALKEKSKPNQPKSNK